MIQDQHKNQLKGSISGYLNSLQAYPQLNHAMLIELFQDYEKSNKALAIRQKLIESNLRLVVYVAKNQKGHNIPIEDLIQEGNIGLIKAIDRFDWRKGFHFSTYAIWWIKQAISQFILKRKKIIRLPAHASTAQRKLIQATESFKELNGYQPSTEELSELINISETVIKATVFSGKNVFSLQQPTGIDGSSTIGDKIEDTNLSNDPFESLAKKEMIHIVKRVMNELSTKETAIIRLRFGLYDDILEEKEKYVVSDAEILQITSGQGLT